MGVLDTGQRAAGKKSDACSANGWWAEASAKASGAGKAIRRTAEVVDQRVVPVFQEFADHPDTRAAQIDAVIEALRNGCRRVGMIVVTTAIEMEAASNRNAIPIFRSAER